MDPSLWQQIEKLYHAALECDPSERAALLARADPDLRREVESLLAQGSGAASLDHPAWEDAASLLGSTVAMLTPGTQLGPYKIEGPLGSGGMGEVFPRGRFLVAFSVLAFVHFREHLPQGRSLRFQIPSRRRRCSTSTNGSRRMGALAFSDYLAGGPLWVRPLNSSAAQRLVGTEGLEYPFWSPDSESIGFFADGKLKRIEVSGGPPSLADAASGRGGTWSSSDKGDRDNDGVILFTPTRNSPILRISARGGAVSPVTKLRTGEFSHRLPWFLPDGRHFFYSATHDALSNRNTIHLDDLSSQEDRVIGEADSEAVYSQGFLLFMRQGISRWPSRLMPGAGLPSETPSLWSSRSMFEGKTFYGDFSASTDGLLAFRNLSAGSLQLTWVDRKGRQLGLLGEPGSISELQFSPDRKRVATTRAGGTPANTDVWIYDAASGLRLPPSPSIPQSTLARFGPPTGGASSSLHSGSNTTICIASPWMARGPGTALFR